MTPSLITMKRNQCSITPNTKVEKDEFGNVIIRFSHEAYLSCNRKEDYEALVVLATKAQTFFDA